MPLLLWRLPLLSPVEQHPESVDERLYYKR